MPQLDFFVWFDSLLTANNFFILFTVIGVTAGVLVIKRGVGVRRFWVWCSRGLLACGAFRVTSYV